jgi:hypothetical protein
MVDLLVTVQLQSAAGLLTIAACRRGLCITLCSTAKREGFLTYNQAVVAAE